MNVQTLPRKDIVVKTAFVPKQGAMIFSDYEQIELRLLAYYMALMGDPSMADAIKAGLDLHTESAMAALKLNRQPTDEERQVGKTYNFSIVYGGGTPTLMRQLGITYPEAREGLNDYHTRWPGIRRLQDRIQKRLQQRGYITTLWGRHLHPESEHKALNALVQGCAADLMKSALVTTHRWLKEGGFDAHLVSVIHDELVLDSPLDEVPVIAENLPDLMRAHDVHKVVPIDVDIAWTTTNWAGKTAYIPKGDHGHRANRHSGEDRGSSGGVRDDLVRAA